MTVDHLEAGVVGGRGVVHQQLVRGRLRLAQHQVGILEQVNHEAFHQNNLNNIHQYNLPAV